MTDTCHLKPRDLHIVRVLALLSCGRNHGDIVAWEYRVTIRLALPPTQWPVVSNNRTTLIYVTRKAAALGGGT